MVSLDSVAVADSFDLEEDTGFDWEEDSSLDNFLDIVVVEVLDTAVVADIASGWVHRNCCARNSEVVVVDSYCNLLADLDFAHIQAGNFYFD